MTDNPDPLATRCPNLACDDPDCPMATIEAQTLACTQAVLRSVNRLAALGLVHPASMMLGTLAAACRSLDYHREKYREIFDAVCAAAPDWITGELLEKLADCGAVFDVQLRQEAAKDGAPPADHIPSGAWKEN